jgi:hypothetical protein
MAARRKLDLAGFAEVTEILETSPAQATRWTQREDFPEPIARLRATPVWRATDVRRWKEERDVERTAQAFRTSKANARRMMRNAEASGIRPDGTIIDT